MAKIAQIKYENSECDIFGSHDFLWDGERTEGIER